ncbi:MAG TPA: aspartate kinase [Spongiibacteraceae bacterium]|nr:aspartate kinase [Spongiibacteraceae bacterium]
MPHTVEKIGGTSMNDYMAVRDNIIKSGEPNGRILVVSAYGGITNKLLEQKHTGEPGVYALFANADEDNAWREALLQVRATMHEINAELFGAGDLQAQANRFIDARLDDAESCLSDLRRLCQHGHFTLEQHLQTVREMLASLGEAHSAWNTAHLLQRDGFDAPLVDLTGWQSNEPRPLDDTIRQALASVDLERQLPVVTGYCYCEEGLMSSFDRGYSEMTFSRIAVLSGAAEAIIHKEYHLSSADPRLVGEDKVVPIGRTNYDVADHLANLGMEAIHPRAAKGLRQSDIPLRVRNTFQPEHAGTLITRDYVSEKPCVEIIVGRRDVYALELFAQDMMGSIHDYDRQFLDVIRRYRAQVITKDINANTITHYLSTNLKTVKRMRRELQAIYPDAELNQRKVAIVSAIGSDMQVPGMLASTVDALAKSKISVLAIHQSMRQVDIQFVVDEGDYQEAVRSLHRCLVEVHDHGVAICAA